MASEAETAVQNYLLALDDPDQLRDEDRLDEIKKKVESATGLEKLKLLDEQRKLSAVRPNDYVEGFIKHAKTYAEDNDIDPESYALMGVPKTVLAEAGITDEPSSSSRSAGVTSDEVALHIKRKRSEFTVQQIEEETGASSSTVRKVIKELEDEGEIGDKGPDPNHQGRGRAPTLYIPA